MRRDTADRAIGPPMFAVESPVLLSITRGPEDIARIFVYVPYPTVFVAASPHARIDTEKDHKIYRFAKESFACWRVPV
jgi:hypothetical protein